MIPTTSTGGRLSYYRQTLLSVPSEQIRTNCNKCPSCIQIRNICEHSHEATPLLASSVSFFRDARCYDKSLISLFVVILIFGSAVGLYLLFIENEGAIIEEFDYVSQESWGVNSTFLKDLPPLDKPVSKILLFELITNCTDATRHCLQYDEFKTNDKKKLKIFNGQVSYNFYQDEMGKIFEGRGWSFQSECEQQEGCDDILTIGVLEKQDISPSTKQIRKLKAFLDYGVMDNDLHACYQILVSHMRTRYFDDLATTIEQMNRRNGACMVWK